MKIYNSFFGSWLPIQKNVPFYFFALFFLICNSFAQHQHGVGELVFVTEGQKVEIEIKIPGGDVLGFEHAPESKEDSLKISNAQSYLEKAGTWLLFPKGASCKQLKSNVKYEEEAQQRHAGNHHHHGDHHHHEEHEEKTVAGHFEFKGVFNFSCKSPNKLKNIQLGLFDRFPSLAKINYTAVGKRQTQGSLNKKQNAITDF